MSFNVCLWPRLAWPLYKMLVDYEFGLLESEQAIYLLLKLVKLSSNSIEAESGINNDTKLQGSWFLKVDG